MGSCGAKEKRYDENDLVKLVKIQNLWRRKKAARRVNGIKNQKMKNLFSKQFE
jgi:hypothetical protein